MTSIFSQIVQRICEDTGDSIIGVPDSNLWAKVFPLRQFTRTFAVHSVVTGDLQSVKGCDVWIAG